MCNCCNGTEELKEIHNFGTTKVSVHKEGGIVIDGEGLYICVNIKYCPMCGRKW